MSLVESHEYDDIINMPHHTSSKHPQMSLYDRAAQFSPFAALTGFESAIEETGRITERRVELSEDEKEVLDLRFREIRERLARGEDLDVREGVARSGSERPLVTLTYFQADALKEGGEYVTVTGKVKKLDEEEHRLVFEDGMSVAMDEVVGCEIVVVE